MKKGLRKLILSGTALAAVAATLGTSTYAWYTTNTEVQANNITGASADTGAASIFISDTGADGTWKQKLDAEQDEITLVGAQTTATGLLPVTLNSEGAWVDQKGTTNDAPTYVEFTLWYKTAKTDSDVKIGFKTITIKNTTSELPATEDLIGGGTYTQDVVGALAMQVTSSTAPVAFNQKVGHSLTPGNGIVANAAGYTYTAGGVSGYTAHTYCNAVAEGSVTKTSTDTINITANEVFAVLPAAGTPVSATFRIFLDGADVDCFDACKGQTFKVSFAYTIVE